MKKFGRFGFMAFGMVLVGLIFCWGTGCSSDKPKDKENIAKGKSLLAEGKGDDARVIFSAELSDNPNSCDGLYGRVLADFQALLRLTNDLLAAGAGLLVGGIEPKMVVDAYPYLDSFLDPFRKNFIEMEADTDRIAELNCTFFTDSYKILLTAEGEDPVLNVVLSGEWSKVEALFIGGQLHMILGLIDYISAHNLMVDLDSLLNMVQFDVQGSKFIFQARSLGGFIQVNPYFLGQSENRWEMMGKVDDEWAEGLAEYSGMLEALESEKDDPSDDIVGFIDNDNNGFSAGDEITLGTERVSTVGGSTFLGRIRVLVPDYVSRDVILSLKGFLDKARAALEAVDGGGPAERIVLADLNPVLEVFYREIGAALSFTPTQTFPDVIQLDLKAFFTDPKPLRNFLPAISEVRSGVYEFMIEGEAAPGAGCPSECMADGVTIVVGDATHFQDGYLIPADCITAEADGIINPIPYVAFTDPTFNGLLWVNLEPIDDNVGSCPADPAGYQTANRYSLNKLIAGLIVGKIQIPDFGIFF